MISNQCLFDFPSWLGLTRTFVVLLAVPLIVLNTLVIVVELLFGGR